MLSFIRISSCAWSGHRCVVHHGSLSHRPVPVGNVLCGSRHPATVFFLFNRRRRIAVPSPTRFRFAFSSLRRDTTGFSYFGQSPVSLVRHQATTSFRIGVQPRRSSYDFVSRLACSLALDRRASHPCSIASSRACRYGDTNGSPRSTGGPVSFPGGICAHSVALATSAALRARLSSDHTSTP